MKNFILIVFSLFCFGMARANVVRKAHPSFTQKIVTVTGINHLRNYEVAFKFFPQQKFIYGPAPKAISFQNKLAIENLNTSQCLRQAQAPDFFRRAWWLSLSKLPIQN